MPRGGHSQPCVTTCETTTRASGRGQVSAATSDVRRTAADRAWRAQSRPPNLAQVKRWLAPTLLFLGIVALALVWKLTPLGNLVSVDALVSRANAWRHEPGALVAAPLVFVLLSLALVPI